MKRLTVRYCGWGEDWPLAHLADDGQHLLFEYSPEALSRGLELSPLHLKLGAQGRSDFPAHLYRLPGLVADALPDGWGMLLMDRLFRQRGVRHPEPLDRLAFVGNRAMGALRFVPARDEENPEPDWGLLALAEESMRAISDESTSALKELVVTGGSPQGARPKALIQFDAETETVSTRMDAPGEPWLVKFPAQHEHKEVCALEQIYAELAVDCGLEMPRCRHFDLSRKLAAFGVARFDRQEGMRVPVHSLAGLLQVDFRLPGAADYTSLLRATRLMTRSEPEVEKAYARAVFNVLFHNRDDHPKNFAWVLNRKDRWQLAPAFDLTFSDGPMGQHHMDICGRGTDISRNDMLKLARQGGVSVKSAEHVIARMLHQATTLAQRLANAPVRRATANTVRATIERCQRLLSG